MDPGRRRQYLEAMGILSWVPRDGGEAPSGGSVAPPGRPVSAGDVGADAPPPAPRPFAPTPETPPAWLAEIPPPNDEYSPAVSDAERAGEEAVHAGPPAGGVAALDWDGLQGRVAACEACGLHRTRTQTVFGVGNRDADLMVIGEAPGADEDRQGEPFVGRAGQLLNAMLQAAGLEREAVYIANVLKCRPPDNRDPRPEESRACEPYLRRQVALVRPRALLAVGRIAAQNLLQTADPVGRLRGRTFDFDGVPLVVTYHPAYLLRSPEQKAKAWDDLQRVMQLIRG